MFKSVKALEVKTYILFSLDFADNTVLSCFSFFFLIIGLYILIPEVITQNFNPISELVILEEYQLKKQKQKWKHIQ